MKAGIIRTDDEMLTVGREVEAEVYHLGKPLPGGQWFLKATIESVNDDATFGIRYKELSPELQVRPGLGLHRVTGSGRVTITKLLASLSVLV